MGGSTTNSWRFPPKKPNCGRLAYAAAAPQSLRERFGQDRDKRDKARKGRVTLVSLKIWDSLLDGVRRGTKSNTTN